MLESVIIHQHNFIITINLSRMAIKGIVFFLALRRLSRQEQQIEVLSQRLRDEHKQFLVVGEEMDQENPS